MLNILKVLRDAGTIDDATMATIEAEHESVLKPLRVKADSVKALQKELDETEGLLENILTKAGIDADDEDAPEQLSRLLEGKAKPNGEHEAKFKGFEKQLADLTASLNKERELKTEAIKRSELSKIIGGIDGLDPRYKKLAEFELSQALKIGEDGTSFFERDGVAIDSKGFMEEFVKANTSMILPKGSAGSGTTGGYIAGSTTINKEGLEAMSKEEYNKIAPDIFSGKITIQE